MRPSNMQVNAQTLESSPSAAEKKTPHKDAQRWQLLNIQNLFDICLVYCGAARSGIRWFCFVQRQSGQQFFTLYKGRYKWQTE